jgi:ribonucleotide monophosphatase NagD (HAD superfamily)
MHTGLDILLEDTRTPHDAVVLGLAPEKMNYEHSNEAFRILSGEYLRDGHQTRKPLLVATSLTRYIRTSDSRLSLGPGPFAKALETAGRVQAVCVGKPEKAFFEGCMRSMCGDLGGEEGKVAIIGDDILVVVQ